MGKITVVFRVYAFPACKSLFSVFLFADGFVFDPLPFRRQVDVSDLGKQPAFLIDFGRIVPILEQIIAKRFLVEGKAI